MRKPEHILDVFLMPGEFYFGDRDTRIRTLLGSCVAITMWHPLRFIGGMCHFMLPSRGKPVVDALDGHYADEAMELFLHEIAAAGTRPSEYQAKIFGGGNMFLSVARASKECRDVACRNVRAARELLDKHGFPVAAEHVGDHGHRNVLLDIWSGHVWLRHTRKPNPDKG